MRIKSSPRKTEIFNGKLLYLPFLTCEVKCEVKITFVLIHVEQMSLKNIESVLCKRAFLYKEHSQSTKTRMLHSVTRITAALSAKQESWVPGRATNSFLSRPRRNVGSLHS